MQIDKDRLALVYLVAFTTWMIGIGGFIVDVWPAAGGAFHAICAAGAGATLILLSITKKAPDK